MKIAELVKHENRSPMVILPYRKIFEQLLTARQAIDTYYQY
jgi:hypothetical protein